MIYLILIGIILNLIKEMKMNKLVIKSINTFGCEEDTDFNHKQDTLHFKKEKREDDLDIADNLNNTGWAYND